MYVFGREIAQRHPGNKKTVYYRTPCNKRLVSRRLLCQLNVYVFEYPIAESRRGMGTSFQRKDFWDRLGGQALLMIGLLLL